MLLRRSQSQLRHENKQTKKKPSGTQGWSTRKKVKRTKPMSSHIERAGLVIYGVDGIVKNSGRRGSLERAKYPHLGSLGVNRSVGFGSSCPRR